MSTLFKFGIAAAAVGLAVWGVKAAMAAANAFTFEPVKYGIPKISNWIVNLPIIVRFNNPTPLAINIDNIHADVFLWKVNKFEKVAQVVQALSIPAGQSDQVIMAQLDIRGLFSGNILTTILNTLNDKTVKIRTDVTATYGGITISPSPFVQDIQLQMSASNV